MELTEREEEVIKLICEGLTNDEIAEKLIVSSHTIKAHIKSILYKLQAKNRARAVFLYCKQNQFNF